MATIKLIVMAGCSLVALSTGAQAQQNEAGTAGAGQAASSVGQATVPAGQPEQSTTAQARNSAPPEVADIIVTAQRRDESLSRTPVAVSVVSAETLANANIKTEDDLRVITPGLAIRSTLSSNQVSYALRGQTKDAFTSGRPGVLPYINEVQVGGDAATVFYDLSSVQTLKGPQGTLFGRSATGGAVLFTTQLPTDEFGGYISALGGNYDALKVEGALNLPLIGDALKLRVAGVYQKRDGFQYNDTLNRRTGKLDRGGARGTLSADFGGFRNNLVFDFFKSDSENTNAVISGLVPFTGNGSGPLVPLAALYAGTSTPQDRALGIATVQAFVGPALAPRVPAFYDAFFANPSHPNIGLTKYLDVQNARGPFRVSGRAANFYKGTNYVVTNKTSIDLNDALTLNNIFGLVDLDNNQAFETSGTPFDINYVPFGNTDGFRTKTRQVSNELQLQGTLLGDRLDMVTGFYYSDEKQRTTQTGYFFGILLGDGNQRFNYDQLNTTYAGYAQGTFKLNDSGLAATAGVRYTSEDVRLRLNASDSRFAQGLLPGADSDQSQTYNRTSWQIGLQDQVTRNLLLYAVSRRAYKSGGFNGTAAPRIGFGNVGGNGFRDERVTDAELGAKYNGLAGGVPFRTSLAVFHNWLRNAQRFANVLVNGAPSGVTVNVPSGKAFGGEFEFSVQPARWLSTGMAFTFLDNSYGGVAQGVPAIAGCRGGVSSANGVPQCYDQFPDTPRVTANAFADITVPVSGDLEALLHGDLYMQSKSYTSPISNNNLYGGTIESYALVNLRAGIQDKEAGWSLIGNVKNVFNNVYAVGGVSTGSSLQINTLLPGEPRTFTLEARFNF